MRYLRNDTAQRELPHSVDVLPGSLLPYVALTDATGLARFRFPRSAPPNGWLAVTLLGAESSASWSSAPLTTSTRVVMQLVRAAGVEVNVFDATGRPKVGAYVDISNRLDIAAEESIALWKSMGLYRRTDELGRATFDALPPGTYEFSCHDSSTGFTARERLAVLEGQHHVLELRLAPTASSQTAVAGVVVDEFDQPLPRIPIRLRVDDGEWSSVVSNEQGEFGAIGAPGREVEIYAGGALWDDDFEPQPLRVAFGANDVRLRRVRTLDWISVEIVCLDATTQTLVSSGRLSGTRYRALAPEDRAQFQFTSSGNARLFFKDRDDWRVVVDARGYLRQDVLLAGNAVRGPDGLVLTLQLQRAPDFKLDGER